MRRGRNYRCADFSIAPVLRAAPFDEIVEILAFFTVPPTGVTARVIAAARVGMAQRITASAPPIGVGTFELLQTRQVAGVHAEQAEQSVILGCVATAFAIGAPRYDGRDSLFGDGAQHIGIDRGAVAERHGNVLFIDDVHGQRSSGFADAETLRQKDRARLETGEQAVAIIGILRGRLFCVIEVVHFLILSLGRQSRESHGEVG